MPLGTVLGCFPVKEALPAVGLIIQIGLGVAGWPGWDRLGELGVFTWRRESSRDLSSSPSARRGSQRAGEGIFTSTFLTLELWCRDRERWHGTAARCSQPSSCAPLQPCCCNPLPRQAPDHSFYTSLPWECSSDRNLRATPTKASVSFGQVAGQNPSFIPDLRSILRLRWKQSTSCFLLLLLKIKTKPGARQRVTQCQQGNGKGSKQHH